ncbi:kinase-like protein [Basidiobolus meristosporus CBS 931.73]|uniref:Kinase-like protein n=1 Tax=Basidiobolus meristosporus CBS 931.73 TaxID=1314790 RepID=A0A1Y1YWH7_9FUNG|nr:kinase-like protein [Basidiobolus meristosporus CBS 931.73]|eukprot:ORY02423.1 kinase-like protein [Basidiobolus meristosporus CBS 931.73]
MYSLSSETIDEVINHKLITTDAKKLVTSLQTTDPSRQALVPFTKGGKEMFSSRSKETRATRSILAFVKKVLCISKSEVQSSSNLLSSLVKQKCGTIQKAYGVIVEERISGSGGSVKVTCRNSDGRMFAVKTHREARKDEPLHKYMQWLNNEITVATLLSNPFIIQTHEVIKEDGKIHSVMEYCPHDLYQLVESNQVDEKMAARYFVQIVHAISHMHSLGIAHRDIKLENICITEKNSVKLIDFGCAFVFRSPASIEKRIRLATTTCGSEAYIAPELHSRSPYDPRKSDIWSIAVVYLAMILRSFPWSMAKSFDYGYKMFLKHRDNPRYFNRIPKSAVPIIQRMLDPNPVTRASISDILNDSWVKSIRLDVNSL